MGHKNIPDIKIPKNNSQEMEKSITREYTERKRLVQRGSYDTINEANQCEVNFNELLDHYPYGKRRAEVSLETAHHIAKFGFVAVEQFRQAA